MHKKNLDSMVVLAMIPFMDSATGFKPFGFVTFKQAKRIRDNQKIKAC